MSHKNVWISLQQLQTKILNSQSNPKKQLLLQRNKLVSIPVTVGEYIDWAVPGVTDKHIPNPQKRNRCVMWHL